MVGYLPWLVLVAIGQPGNAHARIDYADVVHRDDWLRDPVFGDPSFDTFKRVNGNPIRRGAAPYEWPVNGFFFEDPRSGHWFVYVGLYAKNYAIGPNNGMNCEVYRSTDHGRSWQDLGSVFDPGPFTFAGDTSPVGHAPDVSVVYADGRYHMVFDFSTKNSSWATAMNPPPDVDNGIGYAWSDRPEGPFHRAPQPLYRTGAHHLLLGKYRRGYAATLIRRKRDWLVLAMTDSGPNMSWALMGMTAAKPEGPYSKRVILRSVDGLGFHPPLLEFYPAFTHEGWIYAPATSVALNRNFQAVFRVKVEKAMDPQAWELYQYGSVWHAAPVENEYYGIWGQTYSGFVDKSNQLHVMFPARDENGMGTINLAVRPWNRPYHNGFTASGNQGRSLALLKKSYGAFDLDAEFDLVGSAALVFGYRAPLGPNKPTSDATLHRLSLTRYHAVELTPDAWRVVSVDEQGTRHILVEHAMEKGRKRRLRVRLSADGRLGVSLDGAPEWDGAMTPTEGLLGFLLEAHSNLHVRRFAVGGAAQPGRLVYLSSEAILGAGQADGWWRTVEQDGFRYGVGAISARASARGKWNFEGEGFTLWAPRGPEYGKAQVYLDGKSVGTLDFHSDSATPSKALLSRDHLTGHWHAVTVEATDGVIPLDVLEVEE